MAFHIGKNCKIHPSVVINVLDGFLGDGAVIHEGARIEGRRIEIGREAFVDRLATIGGGSCFDPSAFLCAGDWFHMGVSSHINTARGVTVGHEFGCGIETKIFTHGAYIDSVSLGAPAEWAPVKIGESVWLPNAWVNPGVTIGNHVVVAARSLVNSDLPSGCLAGGTPAKILKENWLPKQLDFEERRRRVEQIVAAAWNRYAADSAMGSPSPTTTFDDPILIVRELERETVFNLLHKRIQGEATPWALTLKDQLRRNGIRFRYKDVKGNFVAWENSGYQI